MSPIGRIFAVEYIDDSHPPVTLIKLCDDTHTWWFQPYEVVLVSDLSPLEKVLYGI